MKTTTLGRTALEVSRLCLGTMNFGAKASEEDAFRVMDRAHEHGINFFDTANVYGGKAGKGATEEIVGRWFAEGDGRRERTVLATKVYGSMGDGPNEGKLSALHVRRACEDSLRRLQTDHIDLYQMHHVWRKAPWEEVWQAMELLVQQGKVIYVGSSNFGGWHIAQANERAVRRDFLGLVSEQSLYNLTARTVELEVLPVCEAYGLGVLPWSPLAGGMLAGMGAAPEGGRRDHAHMRGRYEKQQARVDRWVALCRDRGWDPANAALAWLLDRPAVTAPIIGPRTLEQLDGAMGALEISFSDADREAIDGIFPGPGGPAPEAYAW